jgi:type II secretory pathway component PulF
MGLFSSSLSARDMARLCHSLATLYESGVPVHRAFRVMEESGGSMAVRRLSADLRHAIEQGATFAQAAEWHQRRLSPVFVTLITIGEQTGSLGAILPQLARYYDDLRAMYHAVVRQVAYPVAVLLAILVGIPILRAFLADVAGIADRPFEVQAFWILRHFVLQAGGLFVLVVVAARLTLRYTSRESILMYCWPVAGLVRRVLLSRFAWAMMIFTRAGMPLHRAVAYAGKVTGAERIAQDFASVAPMLQEGFTLEQALARTRYFPKSAMVYVNTGEMTGMLDQSFEHLARGLYDEAVFKLRVLVGIIEPLAILALGGMVLSMVG